jgi:hypothetical protein
MVKLFWIVSIVLLTVNGCNQSNQTDMDQGIEGQLYWVEGNRMPMVHEEGEKPEESEPQTVQRKIRIYELTRMDQAQQRDGLFDDIPTELVAEAESDESGAFKIGLPPGRYSVFTVEEDGLFANIFDSEMNIQPVEVKEGEWAEMEIKIDYKAFY